MKYIKNKNNLYYFLDRYNKTDLQKKAICNNLFIKFFPGSFKKKIKNKISKKFKYLRILNWK